VWLVKVIGEKSTGKPLLAATARATGKLERSEQIRSKLGWVNEKGMPLAMSVASTETTGKPWRSRSA
jgi:hypothetical protein